MATKKVETDKTETPDFHDKSLIEVYQYGPDGKNGAYATTSGEHAKELIAAKKAQFIRVVRV